MITGDGTDLVFTQDHRLGEEFHDASGISLSGVADGGWTAANNGLTESPPTILCIQLYFEGSFKTF